MHLALVRFLFRNRKFILIDLHYEMNKIRCIACIWAHTSECQRPELNKANPHRYCWMRLGVCVCEFVSVSCLHCDNKISFERIFVRIHLLYNLHVRRDALIRTKDISTAIISLTVLIFNDFSLRNRTTTSSYIYKLTGMCIRGRIKYFDD